MTIIRADLEYPMIRIPRPSMLLGSGSIQTRSGSLAASNVQAGSMFWALEYRSDRVRICLAASAVQVRSTGSFTSLAYYSGTTPGRHGARTRAGRALREAEDPGGRQVPT